MTARVQWPSSLVVQEKLQIFKDFRVIIINEEIVLTYLRFNTSSHWRPTSTSYGSKVEFGTFPKQWEKSILETYKKLNVRCAAFDVAWRDDDFSSEPLILEVSTFFQPNPPLPTSLLNKNVVYGKWKSDFRLFSSYEFEFLKILNNQILLIVDAII